MIILEGADNTGKSTLAKRLARHFNIEVVHAGGPGYNPCRLQDEFAHLRRKCIMDRTNFISGPVYAKAFGKAENPDYLLYQAQQGFTKYLAANDLALIIHCTGRGKPSKHEDESEEYAQSVIDNDETIRIEYQDYFECARYYHNNYFRYDFEQDSANRITMAAAEFLKRQEWHREDFREMAKKISAPS